MARITEGTLQKLKDSIRERLSIVEVVGEHVVLRKGGANYMGLCPFHSERSGSFSVSESRQVYHCFGCKKGGDLFNFMQEIHGIGFMEALEELAARAKLSLPKEFYGVQKDDPEADQRRAAAREKLATAHKLNRFAAAFFRESLSKTPHIQGYFSNRGISSVSSADAEGATADLARNFYLGAAPASWDALATHLVAKQAPVELAVEIGLISPSQRTSQRAAAGPGFFDLFRNRAIFPIIDMRGKVAGFGGRALALPPGAPDVGGETPKYLNSKDSLVFQKSGLAYGLYQAQKHIREKDEIILVEGYFDVLALHLAGFQHAVATCGTALTPDHLAIFRRLASKIIVLFDADRAGISATERAMEVGLEAGLVLYGASIEGAKDPDEVLIDSATGTVSAEGVEKMRATLEAAKPLLDSRMEVAFHEAEKNAEARTQALKQVSSWLKKFQDPVGREVRIQTVLQEMKIGRALLETAMGTVAGAPSQQRVRATRAQAVIRPRAAGQSNAGAGTKKLVQSERLALQCLVRWQEYSQYFLEIQGQLPPEMTLADLFDQDSARRFVTALIPQGVPSAALLGAELAGVLAGEQDPQLTSVVTEALMASDFAPGIEDLRMTIRRGVGRAWARFSQQIKLALAAAEANKDAELREKLMKEYLDVQRKMKEFGSLYDQA